MWHQTLLRAFLYLFDIKSFLDDEHYMISGFKTTWSEIELISLPSVILSICIYEIKMTAKNIFLQILANYFFIVSTFYLSVNT